MSEHVSPPVDAELRDRMWAGVPIGGLPETFRVLDMADIVNIRRSLAAGYLTDEELRADGAVELEELAVPGLEGDPEVPLLVLRPASAKTPTAAIVYTNSTGRVQSHPRNLRGVGVVELVAEFQVTVIVAGMRVSPEHRHPAHVRDSYAALCWVSAHHEWLGVDPGRIALMGMSGGGGVAAGTALFARDRGGPPVSHLILLTPMLDDRDITVSNSFESVCWPHDANVAAWTAVLGGAAGGPDVDAYAAPSRAASLAGLPPIYIETGSADTFRDECLDFAFRAGEVGVPVELQSWAGYLHCSDTISRGVAVTEALRAARRSFISRMLGPQGRGLVPNRPPVEVVACPTAAGVAEGTG